jgi:hypothetical protein
MGRTRKQGKRSLKFVFGTGSSSEVKDAGSCVGDGRVQNQLSSHAMKSGRPGRKLEIKMSPNLASDFVSAIRGRHLVVAACCVFLMLAAGCRTVVYEADIGKLPLMSFMEARRTVGNEVQKASFGGGYFQEVQVTINGFSVNSPLDVAFIRAGKYSFQFDKINHVAVVHEGETYAIDIGPPWYIHWKSR